ncbi:MAG: hypothetical protein GY851_02295 [bacterium]|nr:hypothetical protein [bacterium]
MADDEQLEKAEPSGKGGGLVRMLAVTLGIVLIGATGALLVFVFVLRPMMQPPDIPNEDDEPRLPPILPTAVTHDFPETYASVEMPSPDMPASTLLYQVSFECADAMTKELVTAHQARFIDMLGDLHRHRSREEWNDPMVVEGVKKQALRKANEIVKRLQVEVVPEIRVTAVFYKQFYVADI